MEADLTDVIVSLKRIAKEQHLSAYRLYDMIEASGDHVSINTIKKFLASGSEHESFNYHQSIEPIARVLRPAEPDIDKERIIAAQAVHIIDLEQYIQTLKDQIDRKDAQLAALLQL